MAHRLLAGGADVTLVADRDVEAILSGSVTSTQIKFPRTLDLEATAGLAFWSLQVPRIAGIRFVMSVDREPKVRWSGHFSRPAQSVDQRTVFSRWLSAFVERGGRLEIADPSLSEIDSRAEHFDLTVVTRAGRELASCFPPDRSWRLPAEPMRKLAVLYLDGVVPDPDDLGTYVALPGVGEVISYPGLTGAPGHERRCDTVLFEAVPGGPLDVFSREETLPDHFARAMLLIKSFLPPEVADRFRQAIPTDAGASLVGSVVPVMRQPVGTLPSGAPVLGGGDVVCRMDPGGAQGANNAVRCASEYGDAILRHTGSFDREWMAATAAPWLADVAHPAARWTMTLLDPPPPVQDLMLAAEHDPGLADAFADIFDRPANMDALSAGT
ncbi:styrene monooxygenase/indole monooxygenase family protein [Nocardia africana]|uniref:Styrene monooxygenase/indole monooxygenase family protein n=1 Tax=Nocardia africana TaxID=134964 RepID=A0ABW6NQU7_9NOCA